MAYGAELGFLRTRKNQFNQQLAEAKTDCERKAIQRQLINVEVTEYYAREMIKMYRSKLK